MIGMLRIVNCEKNRILLLFIFLPNLKTYIELRIEQAFQKIVLTTQYNFGWTLLFELIFCYILEMILCKIFILAETSLSVMLIPIIFLWMKIIHDCYNNPSMEMLIIMLVLVITVSQMIIAETIFCLSSFWIIENKSWMMSCFDE